MFSSVRGLFGKEVDLSTCRVATVHFGEYDPAR
jgi:hypothetical protein